MTGNMENLVETVTTSNAEDFENYIAKLVLAGCCIYSTNLKASRLESECPQSLVPLLSQEISEWLDETR